MISPRSLFDKEPYASEVKDWLVDPKLHAALSYGLAQTAVQHALTAEQLQGCKLFIMEFVAMAYEEPELQDYNAPTLTQPVDIHTLKSQQKEKK